MNEENNLPRCIVCGKLALSNDYIYALIPDERVIYRLRINFTFHVCKKFIHSKHSQHKIIMNIVRKVIGDFEWDLQVEAYGNDKVQQDWDS